MAEVAIIMPCKGRFPQTAALIPRLQATAGMPFELICVTDGDPQLAGQLQETFPDLKVGALGTRRGYWHALMAATAHSDAPLLGNIANDVLPGWHWLKRAYDLYQQLAARGDFAGGGILGWNDGIHEGGHAPHFLIGRDRLTTYGGWPVWYDHLYGDTELVERAKADGVYAKARYAVLYHNHTITGNSPDEVYALGEQQGGRDRALFDERRRLQWPTV